MKQSVLIIVLITILFFGFCSLFSSIAPLQSLFGPFLILASTLSALWYLLRKRTESNKYVSRALIFCALISMIFYLFLLLFGLDQKLLVSYTNPSVAEGIKEQWSGPLSFTVNHALPEQIAWHSFLMTWEGYLIADRDGTYAIKSFYDDSLFIQIGDQVIIDDLQHNGPGKEERSFQLKKGIHPCTIRFLQKSEKFHCHIHFKKPGERWVLLSAEDLVSAKPADFSLKLHQVLPVHRKHVELCLLAILFLFLIGEYIQLPARELMTWHRFSGIFLIAAATLLLEITLTRIFAVLFFSHFTFLVISTALFGFGFSGVLLSISSRLRAVSSKLFLPIVSLLFALSIPLVLKIITSLSVAEDMSVSSFTAFLTLTVYYLAIALPFVFAGLLISYLFTHFSKQANSLYFYDLSGAALGCSIPLFFLPTLGGIRTYLLASLLIILAAIIFSLSSKKPIKIFVAIVLFLLLLPIQFDSSLYELQSLGSKRDFLHHFKRNWIEFTRWSNLSRIDVSKSHPYKIIWIDGGTNQSFIHPFSGNWVQLTPMGDSDSIPYRIRPNASALIIGPAGGKEALIALSHNARHVTGVEMDPGIVSIMKGNGQYVAFSGGLYNHPKVNLVNDEGRSYIRRSTEKYDIIQQINNATPISIASGAFNLSETYLLTTEAFQDYWDHLADDGILAITRWGAIRLCALVHEVLQKNGIDDPEKYVAIFQSGNDVLKQNFYLKKGPITSEDLEIIRQYGMQELYSPDSDDGGLYRQILRSGASEALSKEIGFNVFPVTDNRPFFNHFHRLLYFQKTDPILSELKELLAGMVHPDKTLFYLLFEAIFLSLLFIILPLIIFQRQSLTTTKNSFLLLTYFSLLGLSFILVEICFIQKFILFMGNPVYSVTTVLFAMLTSAGIGSFVSGRFFADNNKILKIFVPLIVLLFLEIVLIPVLFQTFITATTPFRFLLSVCILFPAGFFMGMPFPWGLKLVHHMNPQFTAWAWGVNGYATVIGSVLCVLIAVSFGFQFVLYFSIFLYILSFLCAIQLQKADN